MRVIRKRASTVPSVLTGDVTAKSNNTIELPHVPFSKFGVVLICRFGGTSQTSTIYVISDLSVKFCLKRSSGSTTVKSLINGDKLTLVINDTSLVTGQDYSYVIWEIR